MKQLTFGTYLRSLRQAKDPPMTQETLAKAVGRQKMTISQFEQGKNAPPQGELLNKLIDALALNEEEKQKLRYLAALSRNTLPGDIADYFYNTPAIYDAIRAAMQSGYKNADWEAIETSIVRLDKPNRKRKVQDAKNN